MLKKLTERQLKEMLKTTRKLISMSSPEKTYRQVYFMMERGLLSELNRRS